MGECPACQFLKCFYDKLKLTPEERKKVESLHDDPDKAIQYLKTIRSEEELRRAVRECSGSDS